MSLFITLGDLVGLAVFVLVPLILGAHSIARAILESCCKHDGGVRETQACDAICNNCGKNLGFIDQWRAAKKDTP